MDSRRRLSRKRIADQASVLGARAFQYALIKVKIFEVFAAEFGRAEGVDCGAEGLRTLRGFKTCQCEMGLEGTFFGRNAERLEFHFDSGGERDELRVRLDVGPKDARAACAGEKPQTGEANLNGRKIRKIAERLANLFQFFWRNFANKFESDVHAFEAHPAGARANSL